MIKEEKRKFSRIAFRGAVSYQLPIPYEFGGCLAYDIGEGGARINFHDFIPLGTEITLKVRVGPKSFSRILDVAGRVVWVMRVPFSDHYQIGVKFLDPIPKFKFREEIEQYIKSYAASESESFG